MKQAEQIAGYAVDTASVQACVADVIESIKERPSAGTASHCRWLACMNPHSFAVALDDAAFSAGLRDADWLVPDGSGVVLASKYWAEIFGSGLQVATFSKGSWTA